MTLLYYYRPHGTSSTPVTTSTFDPDFFWPLRDWERKLVMDRIKQLREEKPEKADEEVEDVVKELVEEVIEDVDAPKPIQYSVDLEKVLLNYLAATKRILEVKEALLAIEKLEAEAREAARLAALQKELEAVRQRQLELAYLAALMEEEEHMVVSMLLMDSDYEDDE